MERVNQDRQAIAPEQHAAEQGQSTPDTRAQNEQLTQRAAQYLKAQLASTLNVPREGIDERASLEKYGIDSLMAVTLTRELEALFGPLPVTLFFECQSINELADYFATHHTAALATLLDAPVTASATPVRSCRRGAQGWPVVAKAAPDVGAPLAEQALDIAIIGLSGRYPGADSLEQFWQNLVNGTDCITPIPAQRWDWQRYFPQASALDLAGLSNWGGFLSGVDEFDPGFFAISPREADFLDPQERLFLQSAWHAIEDAGYTRQQLNSGGNTTGVFAGAMYEEYQLYGAQAQAKGQLVLLSGSAASIANRVSYYCNFQGPSLTVDTMCSSSLTAIHLACHSLRRGECSVAVAGGVNVSVHPNKYLLLSQLQAASSHGRCMSFGEQGDGYIPAEGVGVVVLKPLAQAEADGDHIYGVIKGCALNHGGKVNGYTVPNPKMQSWVVRRALREAGVSAEDVSYVEAHGTGTTLGDPIEIRGLTHAFNTDQRQFCSIGSVKSNIGHCESAAGMAGLTKVLLQMQHGKLVKSLHSETLNPHIDFSQTPFTVVQHNAPWQPGNAKPRIAGLSSFGAGGANAHMIIEEYAAERPATPVTGPQLIVLSARTREQLQAQMRQLQAFLETHEVNLADLAWTLQTGREAMSWRLAMVVDSQAQLMTRLQAPNESESTGQADSLIFETVVLTSGEGEALREAALRWVQGGEMDAGGLWPGAKPARLSLPGYPFARERYWAPQLLEQQAPTPLASADKPEALLIAPTWVVQARPDSIATGRMRRIVCDAPLAQRLAEQCVMLTATGTPAQRYAGYAQELMAELQTQLMQQDAGPLCLQLLLTQNDDEALMQGLSAMLLSAMQEFPHLRGQTLMLDDAALQDETLTALLDAEAASGDPLVRYRDGVREVPRWDELPTDGDVVTPWRDGGVYWITGGLGGLGQALALAVAGQCRAPHLLLTGRDVSAPAHTAFADTLRETGAQVELHALDVSDAGAVTALAQDIAARHGRLDGVLHCAGVQEDHLLATMTPEALTRVLAAKVAGTVALDAATRELAPDWIVLCSSLAGVWGNAGQSGYAAANAFMDQFAHDRQRRMPGRTLSVSWPLWLDTGMRMSAGAQAALRESGLQPLPPEEGAAALVRLMGQPQPHAAVLYGDRARFMALLAQGGLNNQAPERLPPGGGARAALRGLSVAEALETDLAEQAQALLKLPRHEITPQRVLTEYGFDSITLTEYARNLSRHFGVTLTPSLFFSYQTLGQFAGYLETTFGDALVAFYQPQEASGVQHEHSAPAAVASPVASGSSLPAKDDEPIAVIGLSGRFPGARDAAAFWDILAGGRCVVAPYPPERLDGMDSSATRWLGAVPGVDEFDPLFFEMSPREAELTDPRQRLLLQEAWRALEDAGYGDPQLRKNRTGMFVGVEQGDYLRRVGTRGGILGNHDGILAARLAYVLDLHGPAMAINTACSSGLVALHQACRSLLDNECDTALAAGVNLMLTPEILDAMHETGMLAADGVCHAFDRRASGMVAGEACVVLVLKRLSQAQADGDPIHAVIAASGINYDGKTQGITAPNGAAQTQLLRDVYQRAGISPDAVDYVVTHGTGTPLGDPVEINALSAAFNTGNARAQRCALTSSKTNVGHALAASGLVSLVGLIEALRHDTIPASLHCEQESDYIDWVTSPFYVNKTATAWPVNDARPRTGAVSAFGVSGTNAHVVVRGAEAAGALRQTAPRACHLLVISAKSESALNERLQQLVAVLATGEWDASALTALSHTLLNGRQHFAWRCAVVTADIEETRHTLAQTLEQVSRSNILRGQLKRDARPQAAMQAWGETLINDMAATGTERAQRDGLQALGDLYCQGYMLNWPGLFGTVPPVRLNLPGYPFARERYWIEAEDLRGEGRGLHPLVQRNTSDIHELRYSTRLSGAESFLREHELPPAALLEGMRAAVSLLLAGDANNAAIELEAIEFLQPALVPSAGLEIHIALDPLDDGRIGIDVYSSEGEQAQVYCQGYARPDAGEPPADELATLREHCPQTLAPDALATGAPEVSIRDIWQGDDAVILTLDTPAGDYGWPPALIDAAVRATMLAGGDGRAQISAMQGWHPLTPPVNATVRRRAGTPLAWEIAFYDAGQQRALTLQAQPAAVQVQMQTAVPTAATDGVALTGNLTLYPDWQPASDAGEAWATPVTLHMESAQDVTPADLAAQLAAAAPNAHLLWQASAVEALPPVLAGLRLVQGLLAQGLGQQPLRLTVLTTQGQALSRDETVDPEQAAVHGLIGALAKEYPLWRIRLLDLPQGQDLALTGWQQRPADPQGNAQVWREQRWHRACLRLCHPFDASATAFRQCGVYVILGGAGGIGMAFSEYLIRRYQAQTVWLGRRAEDSVINAQRDRLAAAGPRPYYMQVDATDACALARARDALTAQFGEIHGVVHGAIVLADGALADMDDAQFNAALCAKTLTSQNLTAVFGDLALDFMLFFSALQSFSKAAAQANYAAGCCFADAVAHNQHKRPYPVKVMHWGYWGSVGVVASAQYQQRMAGLGFGSVEPEQAMTALENLLAGPFSQLGFVNITDATVARALTDPNGITLTVAAGAPPVSLVPLAPVVRPDGADIAHEMEQCLAQQLWAQLAQMRWLDKDATVPSPWQRWHQAALHLLARAGVDIKQPAPTPDKAQGQWQAFCTRAEARAGAVSQLRLVSTTLSALPEILRGERAATGVLFPDGELSLVEGVYRGHPLIDCFNAVLGARLAQYVQARVALEPQCQLRILEIGAGTGATSAALLPHLAPAAANIAEYVFTDISPAFFTHARAQFAAQAPYLRTHRLDIEKPLAGQGLEDGAYDVAIAANVLHATADIRQTLRHSKNLLKANGLLLINEMADASLYTHLTFGLLDGWWRADDPWLRLEGAPGLSTQGWLQALAGSGFAHAQRLAPELDGLGQQVIEAVSNGVIWREPAAAKAATAQPALTGNALTQAVERLLTDAIASHLKLAPQALARDTPLAELGFDSITLMSFMKAFNTQYGVELNPTVFYEAPTLAALAVLLARDHATALVGVAHSSPARRRGTPASAGRPRPRRRHAVAHAPRGEKEPIAIIGISGGFPGAADVNALWENLRAGQSHIGDFPFARWGKAAQPGMLPTGVLDDVEYFDPLFFGISPREALSMDPQQRLLMMHVWRVIEDAGYSAQSLSGSNTALLVGTASTGYGQLLMQSDEPVAGHSAAAMSNCMGPNRMSFWLNWHGPSEPVDTACSSSLVAVHRAMGLLRSGRCDMAVVGGVNTLLSLEAMQSFTQAGMISPSGRCNTFSAQADGYVRSEGVGMLMLKPLHAAERDGDAIYGLLLGSAENHGGRAASLTAPNPVAQAQVIEHAFRDAGVTPQSVSYIETHGTGTPLGDPIEIQGLKLALEALTDEPAQWALGALKSNIGHLELAAGVAGVIKVLLQMQHGELVASINSEPPNPHLALAGSPFRVVHTAQPWQTGHDEGGRALARRAGVSAFGFGGVNAHVVMQDYQPPARAAMLQAAAVVVLSARNEERLMARVEQLSNYLAQHRVNLTDLAYTLQLGRDAMPARLALVVANVDELREQLRAVAEGTARAGTVFRGNVKKTADGLALFSQDDDVQQTIDKWIARGKLDQLADLWVQGGDPNWARLYAGMTPQRLHLPTYPFARERYWAEPGQQSDERHAQTRLHPLVHRNTSDFAGQRFTTHLTGEEWFLRGHVVQGQPIVPGVIQLEWARAAVALALALGENTSDETVALENVTWVRPLVIEQALEVHIALDQTDDGRVSYQVYSDDGGETRVYSQGEAHSAIPGDAPRLDVNALRTACRYVPESAEIYPGFARLGVDYGPAFKVLKAVYLAEGLAIGELNAGQGDEHDGYRWPGGLLDGALQTSGALAQEQGLALPFAVQRVESWGPLPSHAWAVVQHGAGDSEAVRRLDIAITDEYGEVALRLCGFSLRAVRSNDENALVLATCDWVAQPQADLSGEAREETRWLVLCDAGDAPDMTANFPGDRCVHMLLDAPLTQRYTEYVQRLVALLQSVKATPCSVQLVTAAGGDRAVIQGLGALLRSARLENPQLNAQLLIMDDLAALNAPQLAARLVSEAVAGQPVVRYLGGERQSPRWQESAPEAFTAARPCRDGGVYWITGGLGALGQTMAQAIARDVKAAVLVLSGRREPGAGHQAFAQQLRELGATVELRAVDVSDVAAMRDVVTDILARHGRLNGVIHSAGVLRDSLLMNMSQEDTQAVLAPKVCGAAALDAATCDVALDWMVLCSSIAGQWGSPGQAGYAAANGYLDGFARERQAQVEQGLRQGKTLSVAWPVWAGGSGMQTDVARQRRLYQQTGLAALPHDVGLSALMQGLQQSQPCLTVLYGARARLLAWLQKGDDVQRPKQRSAPPPPGQGDALLAQQVETALMTLVSAHLNLPVDALDRDTPLAEFGFDSITLTSFGALLHECYGVILSPTVFFETPTLAALAQYLASEHAQEMAAAFSPTRPPVSGATAPSVDNTVLRRRRPAGRASTDSVPQSIAVIGMSGCFPQSPDIEALWQNLVAGRDCITTLPPERWDNGVAPAVLHAGIMEGVDAFDPLFFSISPSEARLMDPQQRLLMLYVHKAIEDAGYSVQSLTGSNTALLVGTMTGGYARMLAQAGVPVSGYSGTGLAGSMGPNRMSYWLDWHGPSEPVETACSSSLVAIHKAVGLLRSGECELAVAGGVNTLLSSDLHETLTQAGMLSPGGRCRTFSAQADGYARGEGVGMLLLKPLHAAERDGDHIYGLIRASAQNHGGRATSLTAPNPQAQAALIERALRQANLAPQSVGYIEVHGTGTALGDPIEVKALTQAFNRLADGKTLPAARCGLGTVKSNIGHLELAAGVAGVMKVLLQLQHRQLVASLNATPRNPLIAIEDSPFYVVEKNQPWEAAIDDHGDELPRRAGISSFGFGGVNAHLVLEEYLPAPARVAPAHGPVIIVLSARNRAQLASAIARLHGWLSAHTVDPDALAWTLQAGRDAMTTRVALIAHSQQGLLEQLSRLMRGESALHNVWEGEVKRSQAVVSAFSTDEDLRQAVAAWVEKGKLDKLAELWVQGLTVDWRALYGATPPPRLSLPTYPFDLQRYGVPDGGGARTLPVAPAPTLQAAPSTPVCFCETWRPQAVQPRVDATPARVLCLSGDDGQQAQAQRFFTENAPLATVVYVIDGPEPLAQTLRTTLGGESVDLLLDLRSLSGDDDVQPMLRLLRALNEAQVTCLRLLWAGQCCDDAGQAMLEARIGLVRSLTLSFPHTAAITVNERASESVALPVWLTRLWQEACAAALCDVLYLDGVRHILEVQPLTAPVAPATPLTRGDTCWIIGGAGGLGAQIADYLARERGVNLILSGRSAPGEAHQRLIAGLEGCGVRALYVQADVTDAAAMALVHDAALAQFGRIDGVIHAAGMAEQGDLLTTTDAQFADVLTAKITGARVLDQLFSAEPPRFICYFSSLSAALGDFGSGAYAMANRFLQAHARLGRNGALAPGWPLWCEGTMGHAHGEAITRYLSASGQRSLETGEGLRLMEALIDTRDARQPLVLAGEPARMAAMLTQALTRQEQAVNARARAEVQTGLGYQPEMAQMSLSECIAWDLMQQIEQLTEIRREELDPDANLADYGFDSIRLVEITRRVNDYYGFTLSPTVFFNYPSLRQLTDYFATEHQALMVAFYQPPGDAPALPDALATPQVAATPAPVASDNENDPIAIIGMSGRFPQARNTEALWEILAQGRCVVQPYPQERLPAHGKWDDATQYVMGAMPGVAEFDPLFFEISPREAETMDPRQRLLLQEAWRALEDAGYGPGQLKRHTTGMFVGVEQGDYDQLFRDVPNMAAITASHNAILASRLAFMLDMHGPTMAIDTACSSGLVALHQACQSLHTRECDTAIAAGVSLMATPLALGLMATSGMSSPDGVCYAFDQRANGMVPAEACVALVLKRLSQALADGDPIHAVIAASGINYDGKTQGMTAPGGKAQARLMQDVYWRYRIAPQHFDYIVTHGTGTPLGDPIEIGALHEAFRPYALGQGRCALTSIKPNVGHALAASGLVSLVGLVQALRHETIPASLNCEQETRYIDWQDSPFYVNHQARPWPVKPGAVRQGAVSAFGMSGTNAHVVVQGAEQALAAPAPVAPTQACHLLVLSAKTAEALRESLTQLDTWLEAEAPDATGMQAVSHTLLNGRHAFAWRCALVVKDAADARTLLGQALAGDTPEHMRYGQVKRDFQAQKARLAQGEALLAGVTSLTEPDAVCEALLTLATLFCEGYALAWYTLFGSQPPRRRHLPGYPFARGHYWVTAQADVSPVSKPAAFTVAHAVTRAAAVAAPDIALAPAPLPPALTPEDKDDAIAFERSLTLLAWAQLGQLGWLENPQAVTPAFRRWYQATVAMLSERGVDLRQTPPDWQSQWQAWEQTRETLAAGPLLTAHVTLMTPLLAALEDILCARKPATEILFAKEQMATLEKVYRDNPIADRFNDVLVERLESYVQARLAQDPQARLRILEIGAGTGGTSARVFTRLAAVSGHIEEYAYTDISDFFLHYGKTNYLAQAPYMRTHRLNIEKDLAGQGIDVGTYDIVIAASVLHATRDVRQALTNARRLLRPHGLILLNEIAGTSMFTHLSFALLDGWWLFEDEALRLPGTPALAPETWQRLLEEGRWKHIAFPASTLHTWGQQIVVAFRGGDDDRPALAAPTDETRVHEVGLILAQMVSEALKIPVQDLDGDAPLTEFGADSLTMMAFSEKLNARFGLTLPPTAFFDTPTLNALAAMLARETGVQADGKRPGAEGHEPACAGGELPAAEVNEPVAIIGISAHYARSPDIGTLWQQLRTGADCIEEVPPERWALDGFYTPDRHAAAATGLSYSKWGGFVREEDILTPFADAALAPAQALFVEAVQHAVESAGYSAAALARPADGQVGVYVGEVTRPASPDTPFSSADSSATACVVSRLFGFAGPSMSVNTHSASALSAVHLACQSLAQGECAVAVAGGVAWLDDTAWRLLCRYNMMGSHPDSRSFSAERDGMLFADGAGAVLLKPLSAARRDGDNVIAVIRSTVSGFVEPMGEQGNPVNQLADLVRENLRRSGVAARTIGYVDAAAAGLPVGDALELAAMSRAFSTFTQDTQFCALGAVQSTVGHAGAASGMSQLAKAVLQLQHRQLAPGLCEGVTLDPAMNLTASPFWVAQTLTPWPEQETPPRAMVNAQGYGGFYAGAILEGVDVRDDEPQADGPQLVVLSATDASALKNALQQLLRFISARAGLRLADVAWTLQTGRVAASHRWAVVVQSFDELAGQICHTLDAGTVDGAQPVARLFDDLLDEEALRMVLERYTADGDLHRLGGWWVKGADLDWKTLHAGAPVRRIWLPSGMQTQGETR